jgi:DNA gyrase subunit A
MLALVNGEPRNLSLRRALQIYIEHRYDVIVRRSEFELNRLRARAHILEGLLKAVSNIDAIIRTIRASADVDTARAHLMTRFELSEEQANAILDMQLRRLAALEREKLQNEYDEVLARIAYLEDLLSSPQKILNLIRDDVNELGEKYGDARRSEIVFGTADFEEADLVREEAVLISMTAKGYIKRVPATAYRAQHRGGKGVIGITFSDEDTPVDVFFASSLDTILFFSDRGKVYSQKAYRIPETGRAQRGSLIHTLLPLDEGEQITAVLPVESFDMEEAYFVMATRYGRIKRVHLHEFAEVRPSGLIALGLEEGDTLNWVKYSNGKQHIVLVTEGGQSIRFEENEVRVMGRPAYGVNAMKLIGDDRIAGMDVIQPDHTHILVVTKNGFGKRTPIEYYSVQGRYGQGARTLARNPRTGPIVAMRCIKESDGIMLLTRNGIVLRTSLNEIRETGRSTQGVTLMNLDDGDEVVGIAIIEEDDESIVEHARNGASTNGANPV